MQSRGLISGRAKFHDCGRSLTRLLYRLPKGRSGSNWSTLSSRQTGLYEMQALEFDNPRILLSDDDFTCHNTSAD